MKLNVRERLGVMGVLPGEGDFVTLGILRQLQTDLTFTEAEIKKYHIVQEDGKISWEEKVGQEKDVPIGEKANDIIVLALSKLNEQKKLQMEHYGLYERFISKKEPVKTDG